jgi:pimeloyl-ACP methyl ester carboxylesterase
MFWFKRIMPMVSAMKTRLLCSLCISVLIPFPARSQTSKVLPWNPNNQTDGGRVYHPDPVLFVHGINSNDKGWYQIDTLLGSSPGVMQALQGYFQPYWISFDASALIAADQSSGRYRATQMNYLHTFNYGDRPEVNTINSNSFDHIEWNAWAWDRDNRFFTNTFTRALQPAPQDPDRRITLDERINGRQGPGGFVGIREAYQADPNDPNTRPNVVLVGHSMGGLLSHYYLIKSAPDTGVRRLVTIATPHQGSMIANWVMWDRNTGIVGHIFDGMRSLFIAPVLRLAGNAAQQLPLIPNPTTGYYTYGHNGAVEDISVNNPKASSRLRHRNELTDFFWANPAPKIEYVFNAYHQPIASFYQAEIAVTLPTVESEQVDGDGVVAPWSASGKISATSTSVWNGASNPSGWKAIDPVIFGVWDGFDHSAAPSDTNSLFKSLFGVPYRWSGSTDSWPSYAKRYGENQSFSKYFNGPSSGSTAYTDEPGIADLKLLYDRIGGNPMLIPSLNTYSTNSIGPQKTLTNATDFANHQIILGSGGVQYLGTVGVKNHSQNPVGTSGTNYWVVAGNEYLPARLSLQANNGVAPTVAATNATQLLGAGQVLTNCLVQLDTNGAPQYQYGYFQSSSDISVAANTNNYVAAQGYNLDHLLTPQAERAFNTPVDSATLVSVLQKINQGEAISNTCYSPTAPTRWQTTVSEWVNVPSNGVFMLDFFPTSNPTNSGIISDAWTGTAYTNWTYDVAGKTVTLSDVAGAPSHLLVGYTAYLGCSNSFTTNYGGGTSFTVPALTNDTLAGIHVTESWLTQIRTKLAAIVPKYKDTTASTCTNWSLTNILVAAGYPTGNWTPVTDGLLKAQHFTELEDVAALLTTELSCCGACCLSNGTCGQLLQPACTNQSGIYQGDGTVCSNVYCTGACCLTNGTCSQLSQFACTNGIYQGDGTSCTPTNPCPQPTGACCHPDGTCSVTTEVACTSPNVWQGAGTNCSPNPCPQPTGACCHPDCSCSITTQAGCTSPNVWLGANVSCNPCASRHILITVSLAETCGGCWHDVCNTGGSDYESTYWDLDNLLSSTTYAVSGCSCDGAGGCGSITKKSYFTYSDACQFCTDSYDPEIEVFYPLISFYGGHLEVAYGGNAWFEGDAPRGFTCADLPITIQNTRTGPCNSGKIGWGGSATIEVVP